ncbi:MAG: MiaB/RimO family radical SAM methylthiotransferase [Bacteroidales bacterium]|nr:MiaB/RimO family radical SAM methylthiotransferase [Bacteroidales bacterium]
MKRIQVISLGCSKNLVDSERLMSVLQGRGYQLVPPDVDLTTGKVDEVIVNTCGFINDAKEESINTILEAARAKKEGYISKLSVFGCLSQRYRGEIEAEIPEVDSWQGVMTFDSIDRVLTTPSHYAYLKISEGCDRRCSYCAIPLIRGPHVSVPVEKLVSEAEMLAARGVKELILIAQDTAWYGLDLYGKRKLGYLLEQLSRVEGIEWLRLHYSYPDDFPEDVIEQMASNPKLCRYLDIPLQHSEDSVLRAMRRTITSSQTRDFIARLRRDIPNLVLRTTLMVGHPGEGRREFESLLDFVKECRFERLGAFEYSEEEGTYGASHLKDEVSPEEKRDRYERLMELQSGISLDYNISRIGTLERVLVDGFQDGVLVARSYGESPEVDGQILIGDAASLSKVSPETVAGQFLNVKIESADEYDLLAVIE